MKATGRMLTDLAGMNSALRRAGEDARRLTMGFAEQARADAAARVVAPAIDLAAQLVEHHELIRIARGPVADASRALSRLAESHRDALMHARAILNERDSHFRKPGDRLHELTRFHEPILAASEAFSISETAIMKAMENMQSPWLDVRDQAASVGAFAELQGLANIVTTRPAFGEHTGDVLRGALGDWRDAIAFPHDIVDDIAARSDFYLDRGFNPALTDFPRPAFREALKAGGLHEDSVSAEDRVSAEEYYRPPKRERSVEEEIRFRATNQAHDSLMRLEVRLRKFIDDLMTGEFGQDWPERQLPNGLHDRWAEKKKRAETGVSKTWPLIAYADFTDYERVICRKENWSRIFRGFFVRPEFVRESFQRLHLLRLAVMHARPITQDDELLLLAEVIRLTRAMEMNSAC